MSSGSVRNKLKLVSGFNYVWDCDLNLGEILSIMQILDKLMEVLSFIQFRMKPIISIAKRMEK